MEAIAAFSLACNVIQAIDAAKSAVEVIYGIYKRGTSIDNAHLQEKTRNLRDLRLDIAAKDPQLQQIAQSCQKISQELLDELARLQSKSKRDVFAKSIRAFRKKGCLEKLEAKLADHERTFSTGLLVRLSEQNDAQAILRSVEFQTLDKTLKVFVTNLAAGNIRLESVLKDEALSTREHVTREHVETRALMDKAHLLTITDQQRQRFLGSLKYLQMNARRNQISSNYPDTFEWILTDEYPAKVKKTPWPSFKDWLKSDGRVYFIEGKAASGKSTLMKFMIEDDRTKELLKDWNPSFGIISHYFWLSGDAMERNLRGCLCALIHQVFLLNEDDLITEMRFDKDYPNDWSVSELVKILYNITASHHLAIFLDGLDESEPKDRDSLVKMINELAARPNLKICLSSRPEQFYIHNFRSYPKLRLQDLNRADIIEYVQSRLSKEQENGNVKMHEEEHKNLTQQLVNRADGVFLWVHVALTSVLRGLSIHASKDELQARINQLPSDLETLYDDMLRRLGDDTSLVLPEAALYFNLQMRFDELGATRSRFDGCGSLVSHTIAACRNNGTKDSTITRAFLEQALHDTMHRIHYVCAGLLEVDFFHLPVEFSSQFQSVRFSHRTAYDFLLQPKGQSIVSKHPVSLFQACRIALDSSIILNCLYDIFTAGFIAMGWVSRISSAKALRRPGSEDATFSLLSRIQQFIVTSKYTRKDGSQRTSIETDELTCTNRSSREFDVINHGSSFTMHSAVDFIGMTIEKDVPEYFRLTIEPWLRDPKKCALLSRYYLDYLLLCVSRVMSMKRYPNQFKIQGYWSSVAELLIEAGANCRTEFFLPVYKPTRQCAAINFQYGHDVLLSDLDWGAPTHTPQPLENPLLWHHWSLVLPGWVFLELDSRCLAREETWPSNPRGQCHCLTSRFPDLLALAKRVTGYSARFRDQAGSWEGLKCVSDEESIKILKFLIELRESDVVYLDDESPEPPWIRRILNKAEAEKLINLNSYLIEKGYMVHCDDPRVLKGPIPRFVEGVDPNEMPEW